MLLLHHTVNFWEQIKDWEVCAQSAHAEVVVAREVRVVSHLSELREQGLQCLLAIPPHPLQAFGLDLSKFVVCIAVDLISVMSDDSKVPRAATKDGVEEVVI